MGGEKVKTYGMTAAQWGSPPRGRGKGAEKISRRKSSRITPAWAGKRSGQTACTSTRPDHPRVGGEKDNAEFREKIDQGSPPHGRGKAHGRRGQETGRGITPAWAGKSGKGARSDGGCWDHPRVGGEKVQLRSGKQTQKGSHPHGRGKAESCVGKGDNVGITPAWAGKRSTCCCVSPAPTDHPRVGGEKPFLFYGGSSDSGSPPHGREKGLIIFDSSVDNGITPA